jgi:trimeric autotransporter adhesin
MAQIAAFETDDIAVMSSGQLDAMLTASPIVLDLDGKGIVTRSAAEGVHFDLAGTGNTSQRAGWVGAGDALLVRDRNGNGVIDDGTELYGVATRNEHGQRMGNGYAALGLEDSNGDGRINAADANWKELKLWVDANHDGKTDAGELHGLADFGVVELNLDYATSDRVDKGNLVGLVSNWTKADGTQHEMADVWFGKERPPLTELLAAPTAELLAGAPAAESGGSHHATLLPPVRSSLLEDDRQVPLI